MIAVDPPSQGLGQTPGPVVETCIRPLTGQGTSWCRYDTDSFMSCKSDGDCQYPYDRCGSLNLCVLSGPDPIQVADFTYEDVGINATEDVSGAFYTAGYPKPSTTSFNITGGTILGPYRGFLETGQFDPALGISFSAKTAFCVTSLAIIDKQPPLPYHTAIYEDPSPILVAAAIKTISATEESLFVSFFRENYSEFLLPTLMTTATFPTGGQMWNPGSIRGNSGPIMPFVSNPIVTPWVFLPDAAGQTTMVHTLFVESGVYRISVCEVNFQNGQSVNISTVYSAVQASNPTLLLAPINFLVTSWDAITIFDAASQSQDTSVLLYGLNRLNGKYELKLLPLLSTSGPDNRTPTAIDVNVPTELINSENTHPRFSKANSPNQPLLIVTFFTIIPGGLQLTMFAVRSFLWNITPPSIDFTSGFPCSGKSPIIGGVTSIEYVTSLTGGQHFGGFVVQCSTTASAPGQAFLVVQVNAQCVQSTNFFSGTQFSAVYWRRLAGEPGPPYDYTLYPIGGGSLPFFLATATPLRFDGTPP